MGVRDRTTHSYTTTDLKSGLMHSPQYEDKISKRPAHRKPHQGPGNAQIAQVLTSSLRRISPQQETPR